MSIIQKNLVRNSTLTRTIDGYNLEVMHLVEIKTGTDESKLYSAITTAGIPQFGDPHPIIPDVIVTDIKASPDGSSPNIYMITVTYSIPDPEDSPNLEDEELGIGTVSLSTSLANEQEWFDINGEFLRVEYQQSTLFKAANIQRPQLGVTFNRIESSLPKDAITNFLGKVNSVPWSGFPAKTWLCTGIDAKEEKGKFDVDYTFTHNDKTWHLELIVGLTAEEVASVPPNVETGDGYSRFEVYNSADFNALGLSF